MMLMNILQLPIAILFLIKSTIAQSPPVVLCIAGQCLQGYSNTTIGAKISTPDAATSALLLPGQYTSTTSPQLLHNLLTSSSSSISPSPGFENATASSSLPLNLALEPGLAVFAGSLYSGESGFTSLPSTPLVNSSTPLTANSLALSSSIWIATNSASNKRIVFWDSVPDVTQLPSGDLGSLSLVDMQSVACSPPCAGSGICSASGTCTCAPGFTGSSCESCAAGFFGPECLPCPSGCTSCDEGISGSGRCLKPTIANAPSSCNCLNGVCGSDGQCACNTGFTKADNGTACAKCAAGFFLTSTGDCQVCQLGCTQCADGTGVCTTCKTGFTQDGNDRTKCDPPQSITSTGTVCPDGSFANGASCAPCSSSCQTCSGGTSNDCIICGEGKYLFNGTCVGTDANGVCEGSSLIADNNKHECDSCGAKCTSCKIPNFSLASTVNQLQCTECLPGSVLSNGKCIDSCPSGTFVSPQDNITCTACDSTCGTCIGSSTFCLTCPNNQLASSGKCVSSCPSNTFTSSGSCLTCHPDCASCSGDSFNQCLTCPPDRPVLVNGRCLSTCSKTQFFDTTSSSCQTCDSSCSSCSGAGSSNCLACSSSSQVLRAGTCVSANCEQSSSVIPGLGVCLSELVDVPKPSGTSTPAPLPTITGLTSPTKVSTPLKLQWWQILLMALGCAFIFLVFIWLCRRRTRKQRAKRAAMFAAGKSTGHQGGGWRWWLLRFGEKLFGHDASRRVVIVPESESVQLTKLRAAEEARLEHVYEHQYMEEEARREREHERQHEEDLVKLIGAYQYPASPRSRRFPSHETSSRHSVSDASQLSAPSIYSQVTGMPRKTPEPRQPIRKEPASRFSWSTYNTTDQRPKQSEEAKKFPFWK